MTRPAVSVLTTTWNRAPLLRRPYESLRRQTAGGFEWIVVDDGSTDETPALLARWQAEADFPITYYRYANNRGRNAALNAARTLVSGDYLLILDSDDALLDGAMDTIHRWIAETGIAEDPGVAGLAFRCVDEFDNPVGRPFDRGTARFDNRAAQYREGITFEVARLLKTGLFRQFSFPELDGREHAPEVIFWNRLSDCHETIWIEAPVRRYFRYDGQARMSDKAPRKVVHWPRGNYLWALDVLNGNIGWLSHDRKAFLKAGRRVVRFGLHIGRPLHRQFGDLANPRARSLWAAGILGGFAGYVRDLLRGRRAPKADTDISAWGPAAPPENPELRPPPR